MVKIILDRRIVACSCVLLSVHTITSAAIAETCTQAVVHCRERALRESDNREKCAAAGAQCRRTGNFVGPYTATIWRDLKKN
jgi:hypothetical protein